MFQWRGSDYKLFIRTPEAITTEIPWHSGISTSVVNPVNSKTWHGRFNRELIQMRLNVFSQWIFLLNASQCTREIAGVINRWENTATKQINLITPSGMLLKCWVSNHSCRTLALWLWSQYSSLIHWKTFFSWGCLSHTFCVGYYLIWSSTWCDWLGLSVEWWTRLSSASYMGDACGLKHNSRHSLWYVLYFRFCHLETSHPPGPAAFCPGALPGT